MPSHLKGGVQLRKKQKHQHSFQGQHTCIKKADSTQRKVKELNTNTIQFFQRTAQVTLQPNDLFLTIWRSLCKSSETWNEETKAEESRTDCRCGWFRIQGGWFRSCLLCNKQTPTKSKESINSKGLPLLPIPTRQLQTSCLGREQFGLEWICNVSENSEQNTSYVPLSDSKLPIGHRGSSIQ